MAAAESESGSIACMQYALQHTAAAPASQRCELLHSMNDKLRNYRAPTEFWYQEPAERDTCAAQKWLRMQFPREMRKLL
jgi:hypothetical protein